MPESSALAAVEAIDASMLFVVDSAGLLWYVADLVSAHKPCLYYCGDGS